MNLLVLGHLSLDVLPDVPAETFGGIFHAVRTLGTLARNGDTVVPVFGVQKEDLGALLERLREFPRVDPSAVFALESPTPRVYYRREGKRFRTQCSREIAPPIPFERIRRHLDADAILVNMVSGHDLALETLDEIRIAVRPRSVPLHFDFHNLTMGVGEGNERYRRPLPTWRRWAFMVESAQLNEEEIRGLSVEGLQEEQAAGHLLTLGVKCVLITRGPGGVTLYADRHKKMVRQDIPGIPANGAPAFPGCGDVFGAAFLYHYVASRDGVAAATSANSVAAAFAATGAPHTQPGTIA